MLPTCRCRTTTCTNTTGREEVVFLAVFSPVPPFHPTSTAAPTAPTPPLFCTLPVILDLSRCRIHLQVASSSGKPDPFALLPVYKSPVRDQSVTPDTILRVYALYISYNHGLSHFVFEFHSQKWVEQITSSCCSQCVLKQLCSNLETILLNDVYE